MTMKNRGLSLLYGILWLSLWQVMSLYFVKDESLLPTATSVLYRLYGSLFVDRSLMQEIAASLQRFLVSTLIAIFFGVLFSYLTVSLQFIGDFFHFLFKATFGLPKVAVLPFFILVFGIDDQAKIAFISLGMFYLLYFNIYQGLVQLKRDSLFDVMFVFHVTGQKKFWNYYFKGSLPFFIVGLKTALGYGLTLVIVSEMNLSTNGIGLYLWNAWDQFRIIDLYACLFCLMIIGQFIFYIPEFFERFLVRKGYLDR